MCCIVPQPSPGRGIERRLQCAQRQIQHATGLTPVCGADNTLRGRNVSTKKQKVASAEWSRLADFAANMDFVLFRKPGVTWSKKGTLMNPNRRILAPESAGR